MHWWHWLFAFFQVKSQHISSGRLVAHFWLLSLKVPVLDDQGNTCQDHSNENYYKDTANVLYWNTVALLLWVLTVLGQTDVWINGLLPYQYILTILSGNRFHHFSFKFSSRLWLSNLSIALLSLSFRSEFCCTARASGFLLNSLPMFCRSQLVITAYLTIVDSAETGFQLISTHHKSIALEHLQMKANCSLFCSSFFTRRRPSAQLCGIFASRICDHILVYLSLTG